MEIKEKITELGFSIGFLQRRRFICAVAQDHITKTILMVAWMNREALDQTLRLEMWSTTHVLVGTLAEGETSGQTQELIDMRIDCDRDAILLNVLQKSVACHTGRKSCFSGRRVVTVHGTSRARRN